MLTITLLHATELVLEAGQVLVLHDPVGLTADRVLAHVYREAARSIAEPGWRKASCASAVEQDSDLDRLPELSASGAPALQWLLVRPPLAHVWQAVDMLAEQSWRRNARVAVSASELRAAENGSFPLPDRSRTPRVAEPRVAEPPVAEPPVTEQPIAERRVARARQELAPNRGAMERIRSAGLLLLSEADRTDALTSRAAARYIVRAVRRQWAVLAATREGPVMRAGGAPPPRATPTWCRHVVCQGGVLRPVTPR